MNDTDEALLFRIREKTLLIRAGEERLADLTYEARTLRRQLGELRADRERLLAEQAAPTPMPLFDQVETKSEDRTHVGELRADRERLLAEQAAPTPMPLFDQVETKSEDRTHDLEPVPIADGAGLVSQEPGEADAAPRPRGRGRRRGERAGTEERGGQDQRPVDDRAEGQPPASVTDGPFHLECTRCYEKRPPFAELRVSECPMCGNPEFALRPGEYSGPRWWEAIADDDQVEDIPENIPSTAVDIPAEPAPIPDPVESILGLCELHPPDPLTPVLTLALGELPRVTIARMRSEGATDGVIKGQLLAGHWGDGPGHDVPRKAVMGGYWTRGGTRPALWTTDPDDHRDAKGGHKRAAAKHLRPDLEGQELMARVRALLKIPKPGQVWKSPEALASPPPPLPEPEPKAPTAPIRSEIEAGITPGWRGASLLELPHIKERFDPEGPWEEEEAVRWAERIREALDLAPDQEPTVGHVIEWTRSGERDLAGLVAPGADGTLLNLRDGLLSLAGACPEFRRDVPPQWYGRGGELEDDDQVEAENQRDSFETQLDAALVRALHIVEGASSRWQKLRSEGATDIALAETLGEEWEGDPGHTGRGCHWATRGGRSLAFWFDADQVINSVQMKPTLRGRELLDRVRRLLEIPMPAPAATPEQREAMLRDALRCDTREHRVNWTITVANGVTDADLRKRIVAAFGPTHELRSGHTKVAYSAAMSWTVRGGRHPAIWFGWHIAMDGESDMPAPDLRDWPLVHEVRRILAIPTPEAVAGRQALVAELDAEGEQAERKLTSRPAKKLDTEAYAELVKKRRTKRQAAVRSAAASKPARAAGEGEG